MKQKILVIDDDTSPRRVPPPRERRKDIPLLLSKDSPPYTPLPD